MHQFKPMNQFTGLKLKENTFYSKLILDSNGKIKEIDSRSSDAIAIALRMDAPIFVEQSVFN